MPSDRTPFDDASVKRARRIGTWSWVRRASAVGLRARLVALVALPITVMCLLAGSVVASHQSLANDADAVNRGVSQLRALAALRTALHTQQSVLVFDLRIEELGITPDTAETTLGIDMQGRVDPARARADQALTTLGLDSPINRADLQLLYAGIDSGSVGKSEAEQRFAVVISEIGDVTSARLDRLQANGAGGTVVAGLDSLRAAMELVDVATPQGVDLSRVMFPAPGSTPQDAAAVIDRLRDESVDFTAGVARLRQLGIAGVVDRIAQVEGDGQVQEFEQLVASVLLGEPLAGAGTATGDSANAIKLVGYYTRETLLDDLVPTSADAVSREARRLSAEERAALLAWALATAALALATIGVALLVGRSTSKPLKDLADYARAINNGHLDAEPSASCGQGPRETRVMFGVLGDLVANLHLLDAKTNALARCDFDNPVLLEPLPGRLGQSLESSIAVLSGSIAERDQLQNHLAHEATHDSLTGIPNRPAAITAIEAAIHRADRTGGAVAVLFIDLNEFKAVNDSHGQKVGDEVLRQVATRLSVDLRLADFVARLGGDEFVVIAEGIVDIAQATNLARRAIDTIAQPIEIGGHHISIDAAVGVALTLDGPDDPLRVLARADAAMYRAKRHDRSAIEIFDASLQQQMIEREDIESALAAALADPAGGGLQLHYQPVFDAASGAIVGVEALIRWDRPDHGRLAPDSFIPIAEVTSLIIDVDCWVLAEATRQLVEWSGIAELSAIRAAVNISGRHLLSGKLPDHIRTVLAQTGIDPQRLTIEITETVLLNDLVGAAAELEAVRGLGIEVAIDDFGTGYTSLAHLQHLPIDTIKIDRSFVSQLNQARGSALVRMVTDLGHAIDVNIVAEGVETGEELIALKAMGADHLQGYLLSRPLTPEALATLVEQSVAAGR